MLSTRPSLSTSNCTRTRPSICNANALAGYCGLSRSKGRGPLLETAVAGADGWATGLTSGLLLLNGDASSVTFGFSVLSTVFSTGLAFGFGFSTGFFTGFGLGFGSGNGTASGGGGGSGFTSGSGSGSGSGATCGFGGGAKSAGFTIVTLITCCCCFGSLIGSFIVTYSKAAMIAMCMPTAIANGKVMRINPNFFSGIMIHFPREAASLNANRNHIQHRDDNYSQIRVYLI